MELCQLVQGTAGAGLPADSVQFEPFDLEYLRQAFTLRETGLISLTEVSPVYCYRLNKEKSSSALLLIRLSCIWCSSLSLGFR